MRKKVFEPLGMTRTTFDYATALKGDVAMPHGDDVDGKVVRDRMEVHYPIYPVRPAGGVWTSPRELARYVEMELAKGMLPGGKRLVSAENLLARYQPKVPLGEDATYGMALMVEKRYGIPVVHHGGDMPGYHSDMIWLPEHGVGAVILTNADSGVMLRGLLQRRLLEVLFDGKPEAEETLNGAVARRKAALAKERERLVVPADADIAARLGKRYVSKELGRSGSLGTASPPSSTPVNGRASWRPARTTTARPPSSPSTPRSQASSSSSPRRTGSASSSPATPSTSTCSRR